MATKTKSAKDLFVQSNERKRVARPQPPMRDARTKRNRDRAAQRRNAISDAA